MLVLDDGAMRVHKLTLGPLKTNCYIVQSAGGALVIDPAGEAPVLAAYVRGLGLAELPCFLTHAHFDHVAAAAELQDAGLLTDVHVHPADLKELSRARTYSALIAKVPLRLPQRVKPLADGAALLAEVGLSCLDTPGHTGGSVVFPRADGRLVFTGDTLMHHLVSRAAPLFFEDGARLGASLSLLFATFAEDALVLPGHGALSQFGLERRVNPRALATAGPERT